jgi:hypothetical protein
MIPGAGHAGDGDDPPTFAHPFVMKADIVNPGASASQQYSRWDEYVAIHRMIQSAFAPGAANVNFGHGGSGRYSFLSWHRYFLVRVDRCRQSRTRVRRGRRS